MRDPSIFFYLAGRAAAEFDVEYTILSGKFKPNICQGLFDGLMDIQLLQQQI